MILIVRGKLIDSILRIMFDFSQIREGEFVFFFAYFVLSLVEMERFGSRTQILVGFTDLFFFPCFFFVIYL